MKATLLAAPVAAPDCQLALEACVVATVTGGWPQRPRLAGLILAGSLARREGSWLARDRGVTLLGDAELFCVLAKGAPPPRALLRRLEDRIRAILAVQAITAKVSLIAVHPRYLRTLPPGIFGYELRHTGRVLWGDPALLALPPDYPPQMLPRADAWRLLANRIVELLPAAAGAPPPAFTPEASYPWIKLYLDIGTSLLVFAGAYAPTYAARCRGLPSASKVWGGLTPERLHSMEASTAWKLAPTEDCSALAGAGDFRGRALAAAAALWDWELAQLTGAAPGTRREQLWQRWLRQQSRRARWRGWASALRHGGAAPRQWPRWLAMGLRASPRHWVYEAAAELAFAAAVPTRAAIARGAAGLPLRPEPQPASAVTLARAVVANYHRLLEVTRS